MKQTKPPLKFEITAEIVRLETGRLVIRARPGRKLKLTKFAHTAPQMDGSFILSPVAQEIEMAEAIEILDVPYSTLRRLMDLEVIKAWKRSPGRWSIDLASVLEHKAKAETDPEYWDYLKPPSAASQKHSKRR